MAFLIPALVGGIEAAVAGGGAVLGNKLAHKVVGDAPADLEGIMEVMQFLDPSQNPSSMPRMLQSQEDLSSALETRLNIQGLDNEKKTKFVSNLQALKGQADLALKDLLRLKSTQGLSDATAVMNQAPNLIQNQPSLTSNPVPQAQVVTSPGLNVQAREAPPTLQTLIQNLQAQAVPQSQVQDSSALTRNEPSTTFSAVYKYPVSRLPLQASQPISKNVLNQGTVIPRPQVEGTSSSQGTTNLRTTASDTVQGVGQALKGAASDAGKVAVTALGNAAAEVGKGVLSHLGKLAAAKIGDFSSILAKKIVGDAVPANDHRIGTWMRSEKVVGDAEVSTKDNPKLMALLQQMANGGSAPKSGEDKTDGKIVGDAPPGVMEKQDETMTDEQVAAAAGNLQSSPSLALMSHIQLDEQMLESGKVVEFTSDVSEAARMIARLGEEVSGVFKTERLISTRTQVGNQYFWNTYFTLRNPRLDYDAKVTTESGAEVNNGTSNDFGYLYLARFHMFPVTSVTSIPMLPSATLTTLGPLLSGSSLTEYARDLRLTTLSFNYDLIARLWPMIADNLENQTGYSFIRQIIVLLDLLCDLTGVIPGTEYGEITSNLYVQPTARHRNNENAAVFDDSGWNAFRTERVAQADGRWIKFAILDEVTYGKVETGNFSTSDFDGIFTPTNWGKNSAIVFVPIQKTNDFKWIAAWTLAHLAHPWSNYGATHTYATTRENGDGYAFHTDPNSNAIFNTNYGCALAGPAMGVLYVIVGTVKLEEARINFAGRVLTGDDIPPSEPFEFGDNGFDDYYNVMVDPSITAVCECIRFWEETFGTASERASAMRIVASNRKCYKDKNFMGNGQLPGQVIASDKYSTHQFATGPKIWQGLGNGDIANWSDTVSSNDLLTAQAVLAFGCQNALLMKPVLRGIRSSSAAPVTGESETNLNTQLVFSERNPLVELFVLKKLLTPAEEYPVTRLDKHVRTVTVLSAMCDEIAAMVDLSCQANSVPSAIACYPELYTESANICAFVRNKINPICSGILTLGIQFPQVFYADTESFVYTLERARLLSATINSDNYVNSNYLIGLSRIPTHTVSQYVPSLQDNRTGMQLSADVLRPRLGKFSGLVPNDWEGSTFFSVDSASDNMDDDISIDNLLRPLSRGVIINSVNATSTNYGFAIASEGGNTAYPVLVHLTSWDFVINTIFTKAMNDPNITIPPGDSGMTPHDERILRRVPVDAWRRGRIIMTGPRDLFSPGSGPVYAYSLFSQVNSPSNIQTTKAWNADNDSAYRAADLGTVFKYT
ncbi:hypothetical protein 2 [Beihai sea slater virus 3]|uniref:hypothetical protein 2 n=1 Tax=Beihai sea slater virus 3 TaxID=1922659 RepID=UPI000909B8C0|nr:hypothetical protein 2 [Beihai sea slater virus 3]APG75985.1 hypothetical protein 2 [Beihai sea slater virus 3]